MLRRSGARCADQLLCAGCGLGDTCYRLVYAKWSLMPLWLKKHSGVDTLCLPDTSRGLKSIFGKNIHMLGRGCTLCFGTFQIHLSSQNFYVNDLGMTRPIFARPRAKRIHQSGDTKDLDWILLLQKNNILCFSTIQKFSLWKITTVSVFQTYRNSSC